MLERADTHVTEGKSKSASHHAQYQADNIEPAVELWDIVKGWTSSSLQIDGREASKKDLVYHGLGCFQKYLKSDEDRQYCFGQDWHQFNFVGCTRMGMGAFNRGDVPVDLGPEAASWNNLGSFDEEEVWHFDKKSLRQRTQKRMESNCHCPLLQSAPVREAISRIPDRIDIETSTEWFRNDHIPEIPDHAYHNDDVLDGVVLKVEGFSKLNPYTYQLPAPYPSHREYYIEENLSMAIDGTKDRSRAEMLLEPPIPEEESSPTNEDSVAQPESFDTAEEEIETRRGALVAVIIGIVFLLAAVLYTVYV